MLPAAFALAAVLATAGDAAAQTTDVCSRTPAVRTAIVAEVGVSDCADVTAEHLAGITGTLNLSGKSIATLQAGDFDGLTALETLWLGNNSLTSLPAGVFEKLTALETLWLFGNSLTALPSGVFDKLTALTDLNLNENSLASLRAGVFDKLTKLTELDLNGNSLASLPAGVFDKLTALTDLRLQGNRTAPFKPVANAGADRTVLAGASVRLSGTATGAWGDNISTWTWQQVDGASSNTAATTGLVTLTNATSANPSFTAPASGTLYFRLIATPRPAANTARGIAVSAFDWVAITANASATNAAPTVANAIPDRAARADEAFSYTFPANTFNDTDTGDALTYTATKGDGTILPSWLSFDATGRTFSGTPAVADAGTLTVKVTAEDLNGGSVSDSFDIVVHGTDVCDRTPAVRDAILAAVTSVTACAALTPTHLAAIADLNLGNMSISTLMAGDFDGLTALTTLFLHSNSLTSLPEGVFDRLTALTGLDLSSNSLSSLPEGVFDRLTALTSLHLHNNRLTSLPEGVFDRLTVLDELQLSRNSLSSLPAEIFDKLTVLTFMRLNDNPGAPFKPVASAGADQTVLPSVSVTLTGTATGAWGDNVTWAWTQVDGPSSETEVTGADAVTLTVDPDNPAIRTFTAPATSATLHFRLVATPEPEADTNDGTAVSAADWVTVETVAKALPTDGAVSAPWGGTYVFSLADFNFADPTRDPSNIESIRITTLPEPWIGRLHLRGKELWPHELSTLPVEDLTASREDIEKGRLEYQTPRVEIVPGSNPGRFMFTVTEGAVESGPYRMLITNLWPNQRPTPGNLVNSMVNYPNGTNQNPPDFAQGFTTGGDAGDSWNITSVRIGLDGPRTGVSASIRSNDNGSPGDSVMTLILSSAESGGGVFTFIAPPGRPGQLRNVLQGRTSYFLVVQSIAQFVNGKIEWFRVTSSRHSTDGSGAAPGWSIADKGVYGEHGWGRPDRSDHWRRHSGRFRIEINGGARASSQTAAPSVTGAAISAPPGGDGAWDAGETVEAVLTFDEAVTVDTTNGTPHVEFELGTDATRRNAGYASGSGGAALTFRYTVPAGEGPYANALLVIDSLALNGGTIRSAATGADAALAHGGAAHAGAVIRSTASGPTARFSALPASHDGTSAFEVELAFSGDPGGISYVTVRDSLIEATGGAIGNARRRTKGSDAAWVLTVRPSGRGSVTLTLPSRACGTKAAICIGGEPLASDATAAVPGPDTPAPALPAISIAAPAQTPVDEGAALSFTLTRTGATDGALTVAVSVAETGDVLDGTPPASVRFAPGSSTAALSVPTLDDDAFEEASTVTVTVADGTGYTVAAGAASASGIVESDDLAPITAQFTQAQDEHDGGAFLLQFTFSHAPLLS